MNEHFDIASQTYDEDFTDTQIGRMQRNLVWKYLDQSIQKNETLNILELNCGTGEDAAHLAKAGHTVLATDISEEMLFRTKEKVTKENIYQKVSLKKVNLEKISDSHIIEQFDLVFSNFGGLNCIEEQNLFKFKADIRNLLKPKGRLILVIMPEFCTWESLYFLAKANVNEAFRRKKKSVIADVSGVKMETWYYSPKRLTNLFAPEFSKVKLKPIGFFIPPSYLETFIGRHPRFFRLISFLERQFGHFSWQSRLADHYYIELQAK